MDVITFRLEDQRYGVPAAQVEEILLAVAVVELPRAPSVISGVIDLRGSIVPVLDLRRRFGLTPRPLAADEHFIVVRDGRRRLALRTDRVEGIGPVDDAAIVPMSGVRRERGPVAGLVAQPDGVILIADLPAFLTHAESLVLDEELAGTQLAEAG